MKSIALCFSVSAVLQLIIVLAFALFYSEARFSAYTRHREVKAQGVDETHFSFPLYGCLEDRHICLLSFCCPAVRWADTVDKVGLAKYWCAIIVYLALIYLLPFTAGFGLIAFALVMTAFRGKLRRKFNIESNNLVVIKDLCAFSWCCCCAIAQEARMVEAWRASVSNSRR